MAISSLMMLKDDHRHTNKYTYHERFINYKNYENKITLINDPLYKKIIAKKALEYVNSCFKYNSWSRYSRVSWSLGSSKYQKFIKIY